MNAEITDTRCSPGPALGSVPVLPAAGPCPTHLPGRGRGRLGLTLVEVVIAMMVLGLSFSALLTSFSMARRSTVMASNSISKMHQARQMIEMLRTNRYSSAALSAGTHTITDGRYVVTQNGAFSATKDVTLTLYWKDPATARTSSVWVATSFAEALHK